MNPSLYSTLTNLFILTFFIWSDNFIEAVNKYYQTCKVPRTCGDNQSISFPFYIEGLQEPYCGYPGFQVSCTKYGQPTLKLFHGDYIIHQIFYQNQSLVVSNKAFSNPETQCIPFVQNLTLPDDRLQIASNQSRVFLLYNCSPPFSQHNEIGCSEENKNRKVLAFSENERNQLGNASSSRCGKENFVVAPVMSYMNRDDDENMKQVLSRGFFMHWTASNCSVCERSDGRCGFDHSAYLFKCFCPDRPHAARCDPLYG